MIPGVYPGFCHGNISQDCGEQVIEIMRNATGEEAYRIQFAGFKSFLIKFDSLGHITQNQHSS